MLEERGVDMNCRTRDGQGALEIARAHCRSPQVLAYLRLKGVQPAPAPPPPPLADAPVEEVIVSLFIVFPPSLACVCLPPQGRTHKRKSLGRARPEGDAAAAGEGQRGGVCRPPIVGKRGDAQGEGGR